MFLALLEYLLALFSILLALILSYPFFLQTVSIFLKKEKQQKNKTQPSVAVIITAYKRLNSTFDLLRSLKRQEYKNFKVFVVADRCAPSEKPDQFPDFKFLFPENALDSKVLSLDYALENGASDFEALLILDPDNTLKANFIEEITPYLNGSYKVVQGHRWPKNLDSPTACLDALGEFFRNRMDRAVPAELGISATIAGSGFLVETGFYKTFTQKSGIIERSKSGEIISGEDKELQNFVVRNGFQTAYAKEALVFDQKIKYSKQIENQRARWLNAYFREIPRLGQDLFFSLLKLDFKTLLFLLISAYPPIFLLGIGGIILFIAAILLQVWNIAFLLISAAVLFIFNYFLALYRSGAPAVVWKSLFFIPIFVLKMILGFFKISKARKDFLPTDHKN